MGSSKQRDESPWPAGNQEKAGKTNIPETSIILLEHTKEVRPQGKVTLESENRTAKEGGGSHSVTKLFACKLEEQIGSPKLTGRGRWGDCPPPQHVGDRERMRPGQEVS